MPEPIVFVGFGMYVWAGTLTVRFYRRVRLWWAIEHYMCDWHPDSACWWHGLGWMRITLAAVD